ncbi:MAG: hypothetical protein FJ249_01780 [Nitrospira sp.]|nr:hypothetical protein [Nitrospira sp.]
MGPTHRSGIRQAVAGFWIVCLVCLMVLAFPVPTAAGSSHKGQAGRAGTTKKIERAKQGKAALPSQTSAAATLQRCPCQTLPAVGGTVPGTIRRPSLSHFRAVLGTAQGNDPKKLASWRRAARQALYVRRLMLARLPQLASDNWSQARSQPLDRWRIRLIDGDTFAYGAERIRIQGIDVPELSESGGFEASQRLDLLLREGPVRIVPQALDRYGRTVAEVYVDDRNVAEVLRREGYAKPGSR